MKLKFDTRMQAERHRELTLVLRRAQRCPVRKRRSVYRMMKVIEQRCVGCDHLILKGERYRPAGPIHDGCMAGAIEERKSFEQKFRESFG